MSDKNVDSSKKIPSESLKINNYEGQMEFQKYTNMIADKFRAERPVFKDHRSEIEKKRANGL